MKQNDYVISIGRSFGAGGRAIGRELCSKLDIPFYDNELLMEAAQEFGFSPQIFARADERKPSFLRRLVTQSYGVQENYITATISTESLYQAQSQVIRAIASRGPCVIIGRTADYVLRDHPGLLKVFVHAPLAFRARKIVERGDAPSEVEAIELARQKDRRRQEYYNYFTGREWGTAANYDLTLDSSMLPSDESAEVIIFYLKKILKI
ncbi:MAG: cytidylate kinase-like family protein [Muribaculaceae bacterium]|nr:cytidylate kinase-like family protein [Muribaculaceae bacterium]